MYTHKHLHHGECNGGSMVGSGGGCVLGPQYTFVYRQRPVQVPACRQKCQNTPVHIERDLQQRPTLK